MLTWEWDEGCLVGEDGEELSLAWALWEMNGAPLALFVLVGVFNKR